MSDVVADPIESNRSFATTGFLGAAVGMGALALAQPVLDLLGRNPEFLVAHRLTPWEIALLAVGLIALPLVPALMGVGIARLSWTAGQVWVGLMIGATAMLLALQIGYRLGPPTWVVVSSSAVVGLMGAVLYLRSQRTRAFARYLLVVPPVVVGWFLFVLPPSLLGSGSTPLGMGLKVETPVPVVLLVLDEFPVASLMAGDGSLLVERFPSFGRLASDGVWYRNAVTVETRTTEAVPAILSGQVIADGQVPNARTHPHTLFTLLSNSHDVMAVETVTQLCPETVCRRRTEGGVSGRWRTLLQDVAIVYGHLVVPWVDGLPPIDQNWGGFGAGPPDQGSFDLMEEVSETVSADRRGDVARFMRTLGVVSDRPPLRVAHFLLPHRPWEFLPDGRRHGHEGIPGYAGKGWGPDEYFVAAGWRRHLLQVGYVDTVVGEVIQRLEASGAYDSTMLVVVADHGVTFRPDIEDMRVTRPGTVGSIVAVPLFIKYPADLEQAPDRGTIDDTRVETVDIVPTILDAQGAALPGYLDGVSLLGGGSGTRASSQLEIRGELLQVGVSGDEKMAVARKKAEWFPGGDLWQLVPSEELRPLLGRPLARFETFDHPDLEIELAAPGASEEGPLVEGTVVSTSPLTGDELIALTEDGRVRAITKLFDVDEELARFSLLLNPDRPVEGGELEGWILEDSTVLTR